jgi:hypothetical protein
MDNTFVRQILNYNTEMKKLFTLIAIAGMFTFVSCGPSAEEKAAQEKATQDSIEQAAAQMKAAEEAAMAAAASAESPSNSDSTTMEAK